ncbi:hypothetical protein HYX17_04320 [Candidatus Woesearchaeota archaeon]|nr:hypothetical protein [Candidatus Woesearchaeota archaeon]
MNISLFFDRFGLIVFLYILLDAVYDLRKRKLNRNEKLRVWIRILIGIAGLVVDGFLVVSQDVFRINLA